jgi:hypothetical protein
MTSAADFTREQPQPPPKDYTVLKNIVRVLIDVTTSADLFFALMVMTTVAALAFCVAGAFFSSDCEARGLIAGAEHSNDVHMSMTFTCTAKVDGKWIEVK